MMRVYLSVAALAFSSLCMGADFVNPGKPAAPLSTPTVTSPATGATPLSPNTTYRQRGTGAWGGGDTIIRDRGNGRLTGNDGTILRDRGSGRYTGNDGTTCRDRGNGRILCQ